MSVLPRRAVARVLPRALAFLSALPAAVTAQAASSLQSPGATYHGRQGQLEVAIPRIAHDVRVDGTLAPDEWSRAALLTGFSQYTPVDGAPAEDSTDVLVMYSEHALYVGIRAFEPHGRVVNNLADRDRITGDDHVRLYLDTFNDRRRAFVLMANALGVQGDGIWTESGSGAGTTDVSPDFVFSSRGRVSDDGYTIELRIPFKSLRYQQSGDQRWGLHVMRHVQHSGSVQSWAPAENSRASLLAQGGALRGLSGMRRGLVLDVNPVATAQTTGSVRSATDPSWTYRTASPEYGGNVRWGATPNLSVSGTINPDFSQVEADVGQVVYDPRAAIAFPEKRPFFLEANENFEVPNSLIHTRTINSPVGAAKISGKAGGLNVGILSAVDDEAISASGSDNPVFTIARIRRDLGRQSNAGLVFTDRTEGGSYNRVAGLDTRLLLGSFVFAGQVAASMTRAPGVEPDARPLFDFSLVKPGRARGLTLTLEGVHNDFFTASGFIPRPGIARANATRRWSFFPRGSRAEAISFFGILDNTWLWDRFTSGTEPDDIKVQTRTNVNWRGGWQTSLFTFVESFKYPAFLYENFYVETRDAGGAVTDTVPYVGTDRLPNYGLDFNVSTPQWQKFSGSFGVTGGHDDNFDEWSSAWIFFTNVVVNYRPTERMRVEGRWVEQRYMRTSDNSLVRQRMIPRLKVEYQVARPVFVRLVGQYDATKVDSLRDDSRTNFPVLIRNPDGSFRRAAAQERGTFRWDGLFSYQPTPGTVFFFGYGSTFFSPQFFDRQLLDRTRDGFFLKASYLFRM
ncbi:MAG TPA: carbohydrate binding family 9 domain-containing protein [Gemmatimonadaceae bacterium]|nr:carbohydrate binding family 9 domain-containing protein [Gemmatimonadaceae bacterium]